MKAVMISIRPKWCELIASGKKTVEVRKTRPKLETPFKCYIYETKGKADMPTFVDEEGHISYEVGGQVIGEFVCNSIWTVGWTSNPAKSDWKDGYNEETCLTNRETYEYTKGELFYEWHISDLVIYDEPRELGEYCTVDENAVKECKHRQRTGQPESCTQHGGWIKGSYYCMKTLEPEWCEKCIKKPLKRAPQSWCYVESED